MLYPGQPLYEVHITIHRDTGKNGDDVFDAIQNNLPESVQARKVTSNAHHLRLFLPLESLGTVAALDHVMAIHPAVDERPQLGEARELLQQPRVDLGEYPWRIGIWKLLKYRARYTGQGETITITDTGMSQGVGDKNPEHPAFTGRIANVSPHQKIGESQEQTLEDDGDESHGTHVAGCAAGWNSHDSWTYRRSCYMSGTAPDARIYVQKKDREKSVVYAWIDLATDMLHTCPQSKIQNNSYAPSVQEIQWDYETDNTAYEVDKFTTDNPDYLIVFVAGNAGETATSGLRQTTNKDDVVFNRQISLGSAAKNALTVGATWNARDMEVYSEVPELFEEDATFEGSPGPGEIDINHDVLKFGRKPPRTVCRFSSKGPTTREQMKPDIVAPGCGILSSASLHKNYQARKQVVPGPYAWPNACAFPEMIFMSGTSMAAPQVAGLAACLRQAARSRKIDISASTLRAMLINGTVSCAGQSATYKDFTNLPGTTAVQVLGEPPDCVQGFGQASYRRSILHIDEAHTEIKDGGYGPIGFYQANDKSPEGIRFPGTKWPDYLDPNQRSRSCIIPGGGHRQLRVTLAYNDTPGRSIQQRLILEVDQIGFNQTTGISRVTETRKADEANTYPAMDRGLMAEETHVILGTIQKVTWKNIDPKVLSSGEVIRFQMRVIAQQIVPRDGSYKPIGFSLAWISSADDNFGSNV